MRDTFVMSQKNFMRVFLVFLAVFSCFMALSGVRAIERNEPIRVPKDVNSRMPAGDAVSPYPRKEPSRRPLPPLERRLIASSEGALKNDERIRRCAARSQNITKRSLELVKRVTAVEQQFTSISESVKRYYLNKIVPTGVSVPNYEALVATISQRKAVVQRLLEKAQADASSFSCTAANPSAQLKQFSLDAQAVLKALQEYRTSIRSLIEAVKKLQVSEPTEHQPSSSSAFISPSISH